MPAQWAATQNNLGIALRAQGERPGGAAGAELLARAVAAYEAALTVRTRDTMQAQWAMTQNNLGLVFWVRWQQATERAEQRAHAQAAIGHYRAALEVFGPDLHNGLQIAVAIRRLEAWLAANP
jgi:hypothetical protein